MSLKHDSLASLFTDIANKVRLLKGSSDPIVADDFPSAIESIAGGEWLPSAEIVLATFARRQSGGDGPATIEKIYGKTEVWNQLVDVTDGTVTVAGVTFTMENGRISLSGVASGNYTYSITYTGVVTGHKYFLKGCPSGGSLTTYNLRYSTNGFGETGAGKIITASNSDLNTLSIFLASGLDTAGLVFVPKLIDLTKMYGEGNEPSTVEEFLSMHPEALTAPYDAGSLLPVKAEKIVTRGVNQWDEEWEVGAYYSTTGEKYDGDQNRIRSKHPCKCLPTTSYYLLGDIAILFYDENLNFTRAYYSASQSRIITTNSNECYFNLFTQTNADNPTYNHDICINISDSSINGQYFPHHNSDVGLPILKHFPTGLRGVGDSYDEIGPKKKVQRRAVVDLGSLTWGKSTAGPYNYPVFFTTGLQTSIPAGTMSILCAKYTTRENLNPSGLTEGITTFGHVAQGNIIIYDNSISSLSSADFKAAMSGVELDYPLADPIETDINEDMTYLPQLGGTEEVSPISAEFKAEIRYARKINE